MHILVFHFCNCTEWHLCLCFHAVSWPSCIAVSSCLSARVIQLMKHLCVNIVCTTNCFGIFTIFQMLEKMGELIGVKCYRWADADDLPRGGGDGRLPIQVRWIVVPLVLLLPPSTNETKKSYHYVILQMCLFRLHRRRLGLRQVLAITLLLSIAMLYYSLYSVQVSFEVGFVFARFHFHI